MKLTSPAFENGMKIPEMYTCDGEDINPPLAITGSPDDSESFVIIVSDPDAPGGDFVHWIVWNIEPDIKTIHEGTVPIGACEGINDLDKMGWNGPCPPSGIHTYEFRIFALDSMLELPIESRKEDIRAALVGHILAEALLQGNYGKTSV